jgi:uncharacterized protein involved in exopolysaccharide biosynthesis
MAETFDPFDYGRFLASRWKFAAVCVGTALAVAALVCIVVPRQYTATAILLIEPPAASDPRGGSAVSPIYLESLKSYEEFAAGDSLFLKACEKFSLLAGENPASIESLKRRILRVEKLKDTKVLEISVTLSDAHKAQQVAQYLAEETAALNHSIAVENDRGILGGLRAQLEAARAALTRARAEQARVTAEGKPALWQEIRALSDVVQGLEEKSAEARVDAVELAAQQGALQPNSPDRDFVTERLAGARARQRQTELEKSALEKRVAEKSAELAALDVRREAAAAQLSNADGQFHDLEKREMEMSVTAGLRTEQLRVVDPGIVPQRPSFPNIPLTLGAALVLSLMAALGWLTLQYGIARQKGRFEKRELRVARSGSR